MSIKKLITAATLAATLSLVMTSSALAQSQSQDLELDTQTSVTCTTGAYGQSSTCTADADAHARGSQRQDGQIVYRAEGTPIIVHQPLDTGMDMTSTVAVAGTLLSGFAASALKIKNRV